MKSLIVLIGLIALCASESVPEVPGDNSHYVEGKSQYIWMPDGEGNPILVDLQEPVNLELLMTRNGANNQYWLFSRNNPTTRKVIIHGDANSILAAGYIASRPLKVIVHGWKNNGNTAMNALITAAFLAEMDANVIVVDWSALANSNYVSATAGAPGVGQFLGNFLVWLINTAGGNWNQMHLVGFSLGAHIVGNAGRVAAGRPARITGLDPAGPGWSSNSFRLNPDDGQYVEAIHTDSGLLGILDPIGNTDFYPNGGRNPQPGCWISTCSHGRSTELFAASVRFNHFVGRQCSSLADAGGSSCNGTTLKMGNGIVTKRGNGLYALRTSASWPF